MSNLAKLAVRNSNLPAGYKERAIALIDDPDALNQTSFGICGVISIVYVLLKHEPNQFARFAIQAGLDQTLATTWGPVFERVRETTRITYGQDIGGAKLDFLLGHWLIRHLDGSRHLKTVAWEELPETALQPRRQVSLNKKRSVAEILAVQRAFSDKFKNVDPDLADWEEQGHFALTGDGVAYLMTSVAGARCCEKIGWTLRLADSLQRIAQLTRNKRTAFVLAGINEPIKKWAAHNGKTITSPCRTPASDEPTFAHWVVIKDIELAGGLYKVDYWTWAAHYTTRFPSAMLRGYIYSFVAGYLVD